MSATEDSCDITRLEATDVRFFSQMDEKAFFTWLDDLPFVKNYQGNGRTLYIFVDSSEVDENGLREMLALFRRYGIGFKQLETFDRKEFSDWFRNEHTYWYKDIFG